MTDSPSAPTGWIQPVTDGIGADPAVLGGKGAGLVLMRRLGLPVPPAFVIGTAACRAFLRDGRLPEGLDVELAGAMRRLEQETGRTFGGGERPLVVSVRSGGAVSMPGMMNTVLNLGLTTAATAALAAETGDPRFALDSRLRLLTSYAAAVFGLDADRLEVDAEPPSASGPADAPARLATRVRAVEQAILDRTGEPVPDDAVEQLSAAVQAVFRSWLSPRARTYRDLNDIPHDAGTAVTVQRMVFGNRDEHSGTGVAFSRDPNTGEREPYGEVLFGRQGEDVVSGRSTTDPLVVLRERAPGVWRALTDGLERLEEHYRDACYVEFTFEEGRLWLLQVRPGRFVGRAAVRVAVDLVDTAVIDREEALLRVSPYHLGYLSTPRVATVTGTDILVRGLGACPGVATGRVAVTADRAARMAGEGPVVLVRPYTSPADMRGLAASVGVVTARGGPTSHAAVVARSMGKPAVVGAVELTVDETAGQLRVGTRTLAEGDLVTIDGTGGEVIAGAAPLTGPGMDPRLDRLLAWADEVSGAGSGGADRDRLGAAQSVLRAGR